MANQLKMAKIHAILTLHEQGWSNRQIARTLGVHRHTVRRYVLLSQASSKSTTNPPTGSDSPSESTGSPISGLKSNCEPFRQIIKSKLEQGFSAQRIHQDLLADHGFSSGYDSVKRFVRRLREVSQLPFRRMECPPAAEGQVDFGKAAPIIQPNGRYRRSKVLRIVLSFSRKAYSESCFRETTESFIQCLENSFWQLGGVPRTIVIDNLKAAVTKPDWYDPELNPRLRAFADHYGTVILPTKPYTPRHKGKTESGIKYVQSNALKGRKFTSLAEQNRHLLGWETNVADTRIHGTTRKQVGKIFREIERPALLPLPVGRFGFFREAKRSVHRDGHVEVAKAYYSVPPEYLGREVWVRWDGRIVRIFNLRMEQIAVHVQCDPGRFSTHNKHIHDKKISKVERGAKWLLQRTGLIGPRAHRWAKAMLQSRGIQGLRVLVGLQSLAGRYSGREIDRACEIALSYDAFRLRTIRELLKRGGNKQESFEFLTEHEIIRDMADYGQLVRDALQQTSVQCNSDSPHFVRRKSDERDLGNDIEEAQTQWAGPDPGRASAGGRREQSEACGIPRAYTPG